MNGHGSTNEVLELRTVSFPLTSFVVRLAALFFCPLFRMSSFATICALDI